MDELAPSRKHWSRGVLLAVFSLLLAAAAYFYLLDMWESPGRFEGAVRVHQNAARKIARGRLSFVHPGFHALAALLHRSSGIPLREACCVVLSLHVVGTFLALYHLLRRLGPAEVKVLALFLLALSLMVVAPIGIPGVTPHVYNFHVSNRSTLLLRNPTHTAVQPYAILAFGACYLLLRRLREGSRLPRGTLFVAAAALLASALTKPNFALSFVPVLGLCAIRYRRTAGLPAALALVALPTVAVMLAQTFLLFVQESSDQGRSIALAPLEVWTKNNRIPWLHFLASTAFPLLVVASRLRHLRPFTWLALANLAVAWLPYALLRESGDRDFEWGVLYGLQILFLCTAAEWLWWRRERAAAGMRAVLMWAGPPLFVLHVAFGVLRFVRE